jgi:hypothetical protein
MANVPETNEYSLISGVFSPDEARELLMTLIADKLSFHQRNNWSRQERFGKTSAAGEKRVAELLQTKADLIELIEEAAGSGKQLAINCNIEATLSQE